MGRSEPAFHSVVDLGLRDIGVKNDARGLAAHFGKVSVRLFALVFLSVFATCVIVGVTGAEAWMAVLLALAWTAGVFALALRTLNRSPLVVVTVRAEGNNRATWVLLVPFLPLFALGALLTRDPLLIPPIVLTGLITLLLWRGRRRVPDVLRKLRSLLAADEPVLGDGIGLARGARSGLDGFRLIVATDRRVLVAGVADPTRRFLLVDAPYPRVSRFGIEWAAWGRVGVLSLTVAGVDGAPSETHLVTSIAPANLVSIAQALQAHGVEADDPVAVSDAERAWEQAQQGAGSRERLFDRTAMSTPQFDHGLWLLVGLSAVALYVNPFGVGLGMLAVLAGLCMVCGYVSGTRSSLAYIAPLNLLIVPSFFFEEASDVIAAMLVLTALAAIGLSVGSALRGATAGSPGRRAARGSLRYAISGMGLVRISAMLLAVMLALVATATAAGFELTSLRLAVDEATAKQVPVDGRSNLTGNSASLTYTPGPGLREFIMDEHWDGGPNDGARWELRPSFTKGYNVVSLAHYIFEPRLDDRAAVAEFVADKDREHSKGAGFPVTHTRRVVDGRRGYVWTYGESGRYWYYGAWFPQPVHSVRVECVARGETRFRRLCGEAVRSLKFH